MAFGNPDPKNLANFGELGSQLKARHPGDFQTSGTKVELSTSVFLVKSAQARTHRRDIIFHAFMLIFE